MSQVPLTSLPIATISLALPLPPGVNNQYVTVGRRRVLSAAAKGFHRDAKRVVSALRMKGALTQDCERALSDALLGIYLTFYFETPLKRDLDGGLKITLDALGTCLGFDDRRVVDLHLTKRIDPLRPRVEVEIETIADWEFDRTYQYLGERRVDEEPDGNRRAWTEGADRGDGDSPAH